MTKGKSSPRRKSAARAKYVPARFVDHGKEADRRPPGGPTTAVEGRAKDGRRRVVFG